MEYDLEERTMQFSKDTLDLLTKIPENNINKSILSQCARSVTSVGANYREANAGSSKRDFKNKIAICRKEIQESKYWIALLAKTNPEHVEQLRILWKEAHELSLIFNKIYHTLNKKD